MKQFYWLIVGISLLSLASCKGKVKMARDCQTVKMLPTKIDIYIRMYKIEHIIIHSDLFHLTVSGYICKYIKTYD